MIDGIILAAGFSSRTKTNKMLLEFQKKPIILHTIETMHQVCDHIIVVTGHYHTEITDLLKDTDYITIAHNKDYERGMFSSIKVGVSATTNHFFIIPGDYPSVEPKTYKIILSSADNIVVPSYQNKLGHPIYFDKSFKEKILTTTHTNLKDFRNDFAFKIITVNDAGILFDVDDLNDYKRLKRKE